MASNPRPNSRTSITYGELGGSNAEGSLMPVFIAPRYAIHKNEEGYEDAFLAEYTGQSIPQPKLIGHVDKNIIDKKSVKVVVDNYTVAVTDDIEVVGAEGNKITFKESIKTDKNTSGLTDLCTANAAHEAAINDVIYINDNKEGYVVRAVERALVTNEEVSYTKKRLDDATNTLNNVLIDISAVDKDLHGTLKYALSFSNPTASLTEYTMSLVGLEGDTHSEVYKLPVADTADKADYVTIGKHGVKIAVTSGIASYDVILTITGKTTDGDYTVAVVDRTVTDTIDGKATAVFATSKYNAGALQIANDVFVGDDGSIGNISDISVNVAGAIRKVYSADIYTEYRELVVDADYNNVLVAGNSNTAELLAGVCDVDNPLGFMYHNAKLIDGAAFYLMCINEDTIDAYKTAVSVACRNENVYAPICYNTSDALTAYVYGVVKKYADPLIAQFKSLWAVAKTPSNVVVPANAENYVFGRAVNGLVNFEEITVDNIDITMDSLVVFNANGDVIATKQINAVDVKNGTITLADDSYSSEGYKRMRVVRDSSITGYAKAIAAQAKAYNDYRVKLVWADTVSMNGFYDVDRVFLAAQLAALRSSLPPHAPLSEVVIPGVTITDTKYLTDTEYDILNDAGVWVVANNSDGEAITYHQITTRTDGTMAEEESAVSNSDAMVREFRIGMKEYRGNSNIYKSLIPKIRAKLTKIADIIMARQYKTIYGPQLTNFIVKDLYIPESNNAKVICKCRLETPKPLLFSEYEFNIF